MITWSQLNIHSKPILLLNTNGFYDLFIKWIEHCVEGNKKKKCANSIIIILLEVLLI